MYSKQRDRQNIVKCARPEATADQISYSTIYHKVLLLLNTLKLEYNTC